MGADTLTFTTDNFDTEIQSGAALVDFYATWCGPCKQIAPVIDALATSYKAQGLKVGKVDIDTSGDLAVRYGIQGVPTLLFFKDGKKVDQLVGAHNKTVIEQKIKGIIAR